MKILTRPFGGFIAGAVLSMTLFGATEWIGASNANVITACANKKTGAMRYLTKGKCNKKSETQVSWNSTGVAGAQGAPGTKGDSGAKGETGATGAQGESGVRARLVDATGKDLGPWSHADDGFAFVDEEGGLWATEYNYTLGPNHIQYFRNSSCTVPLLRAEANDVPSSNSTRWVLYTGDGTLLAGYKAPANSKSVPGSSFPGIYLKNPVAPYACFDDKNRAGNTLGDYSSTYFWNAEEVPLPTYTPPLSIHVG
jgi:hypothetical protein